MSLMQAISESPVVPSRDSSRSLRPAILTGAVLCIWLTVVIVATASHEFWRDEVRALSLVRAASSPLDLYQLTEYDGHPVLWYLLLYLGTSVVDTPLVLPVTSTVVAFAAVTLLMIAAPFPFWFRCLVIFGGLPLYEYSVMARNYGISMLLMFTAAVLYRKRTTHPWSLAFALALLANTNVHSAMLACIVAGIWGWDTAVDQTAGALPKGFSRYLPLAGVLAGVYVCLAFAAPRETAILETLQSTANATGTGHQILNAVLRPDDTFPELLPGWLPSKAAVLLLYGAIFGLWWRPNLLLAALVAQTAFGVFFRVAYSGWYRHQGLYLVFLVFLYWLFNESTSPRTLRGAGRLLFRGGLAAVVVLIVSDVARAPRFIRADLAGERSASRAFGEFLNGSGTYRDAVLVPEPGFILEALPYYAGNAVYLPRESRFGKTVSWANSRRTLSLSELLSAARELRRRSDAAVLIVLSSLDTDLARGGKKKYLYGETFSWSDAEAREFQDSTTIVGEFRAFDGDESYRVFALR